MPTIAPASSVTQDPPGIWVVPIVGETDRSIVYEPLAGLAFVGNGAMADIALTYPDGRGDGARAEQARRFLDEIGFRPGQVPTAPPVRMAFRPRSVALLTTNRCQLRCTYCYAAAGEGTPRELPLERALAAIERVARIALEDGREDFELAFHGGGEPTTAWELIRAATEHARAQPIPATITLTSNGVWGPARCRWIVENIDGLTVSVDGSPSTQDRNRPFENGRGSSAVVMRNLAELDRHHVAYGLRMTAVAPWDTLVEDVRFLLERTRARVLRIEPAFGTGRGGHGEPSGTDVDDFVEAFLLAWDHARSVGAQLLYTGADVSSVRWSFCSAPEDALIVTPAGDVVTCYEVVDAGHPLASLSTVGHLDGGDLELDLEGRARLRSRIAARRASCRDCHGYWTCAGDCYVRAFEPGPDGHLVRGERCRLNRTLIREILLRLIAESGGVWRRGQVPHAPRLAAG
jgi:uncharacterized protein